MKFLNLLLTLMPGKVADRLADEVKAGLAPVGPYLRRLSLGVVLVLMSGFAWFIGLIGLVTTLFLYLSDLSSYVLPALYTSGICWLVAVLMVLLGFNLLRKPR